MTNKALVVSGALLLSFTGACVAQYPKQSVEGAKAGKAVTFTVNRTSYPTISKSTVGECAPSPPGTACVVKITVAAKCANPAVDLVPLPDRLDTKKPGAQPIIWQIVDSPGWEFVEADGIKFYDAAKVTNLGRHSPTEWRVVHVNKPRHDYSGYQIHVVNPKAGQKCLLDPGVWTDWP